MFSHSKAGFGNWFVFCNQYRMINRIINERFDVRLGSKFTTELTLRKKGNCDFGSYISK